MQKWGIYLPFCFFLLLGCRVGYQPSSVLAESILVKGVEKSRRVERKIFSYREAMEKQLSVEVALSPFAMEKGLPESALGNVIADAVFAEACRWAEGNTYPIPKMCLLNNGGIRTALPAGILSVSHIYEVMPFENEIVLLKLTPKDVKEMFLYIAQKGGAPVAGLRMGIKDSLPWHPELGGSLYDYSDDIWVATSDFLASGGDGMSFLGNPSVYIETRIKVRDAILTYFRLYQAKGEVIPAKKDGRLYNE